MSTFKTAVDILAAPGTVFAVLCDVERWPNWTPTMTRITRLDSGAFGIGSRAEVHQPKLKSSVWEVSEFEPERRFTWKSYAPGVHWVAGHEVEASVSGCRVTLTIEVHGGLRWMVALLYGRYIEEYVITEGKSLKNHCELVATGQKQVPGYRAAAAP